MDQFAWVLAAALVVNKSLGNYLDLSVAYLLEKGETGLSLSKSIIEAARESTCTFPGMLNFGNVFNNQPAKRNVEDFSPNFNLPII